MQSDDILALLSAVLLSRRDAVIAKADIELAVKKRAADHCRGLEAEPARQARGFFGAVVTSSSGQALEDSSPSLSAGPYR
jgi:hypothetical protein